MAQFQTEQEHFWAGEFGDNYISRNPSDFEFGSRASLFTKILAQTRNIRSLIEFGANIGNNLRIINQIVPSLETAAIEINAKAVTELKSWGKARVYHQSILEFSPDREYDLSLISGVLIHMNPAVLPLVYDLLYKASSRYICLIEYYNPTPVEVPYRGHSGRLFKRDFAGEMLDRFTDLHLVDYGFVYHRDNNFPLDDLTWFLLEKK